MRLDQALGADVEATFHHPVTVFSGLCRLASAICVAGPNSTASDLCSPVTSLQTLLHFPKLCLQCSTSKLAPAMSALPPTPSQPHTYTSFVCTCMAIAAHAPSMRYSDPGPGTQAVGRSPHQAFSVCVCVVTPRFLAVEEEVMESSPMVMV